MTAREYQFLKSCVAQYGLLYLWGGKGFPAEPYRGRDCSGFVTAALMAAGGPDLRANYNAQRMWTEWKPTDLIQPGTVALYGSAGDQVSHAMASLWNGAVIGSRGGDREVDTPEEAIERKAGVGIRRSHLYRRDFLGWRRLPWVDG